MLELWDEVCIGVVRLDDACRNPRVRLRNYTRALSACLAALTTGASFAELIVTSASAADIASAASRAPISACGTQSLAEIYKDYAIKGWEIPFPSFADSVTQDAGCYRSILAKYGFAFEANVAGLAISNELNHYVPPTNQQHYPGQRTTGAEAGSAYLTYDLSRYGIPNGQLQFATAQVQSTYIGFSANIPLTLARAAYYQTAFNGKVEINVGVLDTQFTFLGTQIGGNVFNVLGPASAIPSILGGGQPPQARLGGIFTYHATDVLYDRFGVFVSDPTTAYANGRPAPFNQIQVAHYANPYNLTISQAPNIFGIQYPQERQFFINEIGFKNQATPTNPFTWVRVAAIYNDSTYADYRRSNTYVNGNEAVLFYADRQIFQANRTTPLLAYQGIYVGGTASWANPDASTITQDYQARIYTLGMFGRPKDQLSFFWEQQRLSPDLVNNTNNGGYGGVNTCTPGLLCARHVVNSYTLEYLANIVPGVYASLGVQYTDHPSPAYSPLTSSAGSALANSSPAAASVASYNIRNAVTLLSSLFVNF